MCCVILGTGDARDSLSPLLVAVEVQVASGHLVEPVLSQVAQAGPQTLVVSERKLTWISFF